MLKLGVLAGTPKRQREMNRGKRKGETGENQRTDEKEAREEAGKQAHTGEGGPVSSHVWQFDH